MAPKKLIVAVEGTAAIGPFWQTIVSDYLDKIIRCFCGNEPSGQKASTTHAELSLVMFSTHGSYSACLVQRSGWTKDMNLFFHWLSSIPFSGGGFNDAAIAEGLAEALMMFSSTHGNQNQKVEGEKHCILVAASNPYPLPTLVYRPQFKNPESIETRLDNCLSDAETLAKYFAQCAISLSIICPKQLPKLRGIYNAGKRDPRAGDPPVVNLKNPHFLVLISENFMEARSSLRGPGLTSLPSDQNPVEVDMIPVPLIPRPPLPPSSAPSANNSDVVLQPISVGTIPPVNVKQEPITLTGLAISNISSVPRAASQPIPSLQASPPTLTSQDLIPNNESVPDIKPSVLRPVSVAAPNVRILNDVAQARQALATVANAEPLLVSVTEQNTQNPTAGSFTNTGSNFPNTRMIQMGMSMNESMMSGAAQQRQPAAGIAPAGVNSDNMVSNITLNQQTPSTIQSGQSKYIKIWEGSLSGLRQGQPVFITKLEGYRNASASETLAANWPPVMQIVRLISQDHMSKRQYTVKVDFLVFRALNQHGFLGQLQEKKLSAVIQLPSQTLLLSVSDKAHRLIGMLFHVDKVVLKQQISNNQQAQLQQQNLQPIKIEHIDMNQQRAAYTQGNGTGQSQQLLSQGQVSSQGPTTTTVSGGSFMS